MPRHPISDAHEWINEIPTVPTYYLAKPQPRERVVVVVVVATIVIVTVMPDELKQ